MADPVEWFYAATPEQQKAYLDAGGTPPAGYQPGNVAIAPPPKTVITFDSEGRRNGTGAKDFGEYLLASMTPEQQQAYIAKGQAEVAGNGGRIVQAPQAAYEASGGGDPYLTGEAAIHARSAKRIENATQQNNDALKRLQEIADTGGTKNQAAVDEMGRLIDAQDPRNAEFVKTRQDLAAELGGARDTANKGSLDALGRYTGKLDAVDARNDAAIGQMDDVYADLRNPLVSNLTSQAAIADPEALAAQQQALSFLGGAANGSLDYSSQAAGAYADPKYVAMRDQGLEDLYGVSKGSKDVHVGQEDPAAYAAAMRALEQASELSNPAVTDKENFLYEQARQRWESEMRGVAQAKMSSLRRRGMAGGGAELTSSALTNADISQKRVLSDLAASAGAVDRSTEMLKLKGALAGQLNSEGNALATGNANRQLQALGLYQQGAETAQQSSFDQEYKRGVAADNASANNQQTRLAGGIAQGNQANAMQDDAFNRGSAADQMAQYNKTFEQDERDALWGRTTDRTGMTLSAGAQKSNNATNAFQGTTSVLNNNYVRDASVVAGKDLAASTKNGLETDQLGRRVATQGVQIGTNNTAAAMQGNVVGQGIDNTKWSTGAMLGNDANIAGGNAAREAARQAEIDGVHAAEEAGGKGLAGTVIGSPKKGLFNAFGIFDESEDSKIAAINAKYG